MTPIALGPGLAPDVTFLEGLVYVAYGATEGAWLVGYQHDGAEVGRMALAGGFYNSWPRFGDAWLGYKTINPGFVPAVIAVGDDKPRFFTTGAEGNWPLFVQDGALYWQTTANVYDIWRGSCADGSVAPIGQYGAPDGIERRDGRNGPVLCRKDLRDTDPTVGGYPVRSGDLTVGQYGFGIGVRLDGEAVRWIAGDPADDHPTPRCAALAASLYAITSSGNLGVRLWLLTRAQILALPLTPTDDAPIPPKEPIPMTLPDPAAVKAALQRERDKYPSSTVSDDVRGAMLNATALQFEHMGMHRKDGQAKQPATGIGISHDILRVMPPGDPLGFWSDVLGATGAGQAVPLAPEWKRSSDGVESFVPPLAVGTIPKPDPTPTPTPTPIPAGGPSLHDWTIVEWPQVRDARRAALHDPEWDPDPEWVILQTSRRYGLGLAPGEKPWTLQQMIDHERAQ